MSTESPLVTVLMPVYNGEKYLREAIESILNQTFTDFEFLIINDGSTDSSREIILSCKDKRIKYIENETNIKLIETLNKGIQLAEGKYIARMDCDDISQPARLKKQVDFMENNPEIAVCGTHLKTIGSGIASVWKTSETHDEIICNMLFNSPMNHPTVIFRKETLGSDLYYSKDYPHAEDYELWFRLSQNYKLANIPEVLYLYRLHTEQVTIKFDDLKIQSANKVRKSLLLKIIPNANKEEIEFHLNLIANMYHKSEIDLNSVLNWFNKIYIANKTSRYLDEKSLRKVLAQKWVIVCISNIALLQWLISFGKSIIFKNSISTIELINFTFKFIVNYIFRILK